MTSGDITGLSAAVRSGRVRAVDLVDEALRRIEAFDGPINAVVARCDDAARTAAAEVDAAVAAGRDPGPLAGVPALVKDLEDVAGMVTTQGSVLFADAPAAPAHSTVPRRLTDAGAVIVGKSNLPEFATEGYTDNLLFGATRNPWHLDFSPGGSSGGSAAAVAAGMVPLATATDGGGSIRIPSACCGLAGIKPTHGLIGRWPSQDWIDLSTEGPLAASARDLALLWQVTTGRVDGDPMALPDAHLAEVGHPHPVRRVLRVDRFASDRPLPEEVRGPFDVAVQQLAELVGVEVEPVSAERLCGGVDIDDDWFTVTTVEHVTRLGRDWTQRSLARMHPAARAFMEWGLAVTVDGYLSARRRRFDLVRSLDALLGDNAVLLSPVNAAAGWLADGRMSPGDPPGALPADVFNTPFTNISGHPTLSLPAGLSAIGLPFGLQVVAPRYRDGMLLGLAQRWEEAHPWPQVAPGYPSWADVLA